MSADAWILLALLGATLLSFLLELLPVEVTSMCLLAGLLVTGIVPVDVAVGGLSNPGVVTIGGLFVLSHSLVRTGFLEIAADRISRRFGRRRWVGVSVMLSMVALMSAFLNNTAVVAMTLPLAVDLCRRLRLSPSRVLMPLSFAAIFGGTLTLIGTSTNLLVSSFAQDLGQDPIGMFELTPLGLIFLAVGMVYVLVMAPRALPERTAVEELTRKYEMAAYLTELRVPAGSKIVGKTVRQVDLNRRYDITVVAVLRGKERFAERLRFLALEPDDVLIVRGSVDDLVRARDDLRLALLTDIKLSDEELMGDEQVVVEALVSPNSSLIGRTLEEVDFRRRYGAFVLAIRQAEKTLHGRLGHARLGFWTPC